MARIALEIADGTNRMILQLMLRNAGHETVADSAELYIIDEPRRLPELPPGSRVLILTSLAGVPEAVEAMKAGAFGYVLLPFQPGETEVMVERILAAGNAASGAAPQPEPPLRPLEEVEQEHIQRVLRECRNNQVRAARILGIGRNTLWRKLKRMQAGTFGAVE